MFDQQTVQDIAKAVADRILDRADWVALAVTVTVAFLAGMAGSYLAAYAKERGRQRAEEQRFRSALEEMKQQTDATERIRNDLRTQFDDRSKIVALYRDKLEAILPYLNRVHDWYVKSANAALGGQVPLMDEHPVQHIGTLHILYFRRCEDEFQNLMRVIMESGIWMHKIANAVQRAQSPGIHPTMGRNPSEFLDHQENTSLAVEKYRLALIKAYGALAQLPDHPDSSST